LLLPCNNAPPLQLNVQSGIDAARSIHIITCCTTHFLATHMPLAEEPAGAPDDGQAEKPGGGAAGSRVRSQGLPAGGMRPVPLRRGHEVAYPAMLRRGELAIVRLEAAA
jgi:hypothetical protein